MRFTAFRKTVVLLALLSCGNSLTPIAAAQQNYSDWDYVSIVAPAQTVVVETPRGSYTATFENEARIYPQGKARGELELSGPDGTLHRFRAVSGRVLFHYGAVAEAVLQLRQVEPRDHPRLELTVSIQPEPYATEDCLIYTTVGSDPPYSNHTWEAHGTMIAIQK